MNSASSLIVLALAVAASASVVTVGWGHGHGHGAWDNGAWDHGHGDWDNGAWDHDAWGHHGGWGHDSYGHGAYGHGPALSVSGPTVWGHGVNHWNGPAVVDAGHHWGAPAVAVHHDAHHGHSGSYVAANRGSVHSAPLVGHVSSVKSINTDPAPGTNW